MMLGINQIYKIYTVACSRNNNTWVNNWVFLFLSAVPLFEVEFFEPFLLFLYGFFKSVPIVMDQKFKLNMLSNRGIFIYFFMYLIQLCFVCRLSDSTASDDAGIDLRIVATLALAVRRSSQSARSHLQS